MEYYSAIKINGALIHSVPQMDLENIMLSERSQTQKVTGVLFYICEISTIGRPSLGRQGKE